MEAEIGVMLPQAQNTKDCLQTMRSEERGMQQTRPHSLRGSDPASTWTLDFQPPEL